MFLVLIGILFISLTVNSSVGVKNVAIDSPHCTLQRNTLKCDFQNQEEEVYFNSQAIDLLTNKVLTVFISNANKVVSHRIICLDVQFRNVRDIQLSEKNCNEKKITLHFFDSTVNVVPRQLSRLELINSELTRLNCDLGLQKLMISKSKVTELNIPWPQGGSYYMKIEHSVIDKFVSLNIDHQVLLHITNTTINSLERESLIIGKDATLRIVDSYVNSRERGVIVKSGGRVLVENASGKLIIIGSPPDKEYNYDKSPPGVPQKVLTPSKEDEQDKITAEDPTPKVEVCKSQPYWHWLIPTVAATLEALVIITMCGQKIPNKRKPSIQNDMENPNNFLNIRTDSSVSYYSESPQNNLMKRR